MVDLAMYLLKSVPKTVAGYVLDVEKSEMVTAFHLKEDSLDVGGSSLDIPFGSCRYEDMASAILDFGGVLATLSVTAWDGRSWGQGNRVTIVGTEGAVELVPNPPTVRLNLRRQRGTFLAGTTEWTNQSFLNSLGQGGIEVPLANPYWHELQRVKGSIRGGIEDPWFSVQQGLLVLEVVDSIYRHSDTLRKRGESPSL